MSDHHRLVVERHDSKSTLKMRDDILPVYAASHDDQMHETVAATIENLPADALDSSRTATIVDSYGVHWMLATHLRQVSDDEPRQPAQGRRTRARSECWTMCGHIPRATGHPARTKCSTCNAPLLNARKSAGCLLSSKWVPPLSEGFVEQPDGSGANPVEVEQI
jgi:hypothetical protein